MLTVAMETEMTKTMTVAAAATEAMMTTMTTMGGRGGQRARAAVNGSMVWGRHQAARGGDNRIFI